jgi:hypothetical protein
MKCSVLFKHQISYINCFYNFCLLGSFSMKHASTLCSWKWIGNMVWRLSHSLVQIGRVVWHGKWQRKWIFKKSSLVDKNKLFFISTVFHILIVRLKMYSWLGRSLKSGGWSRKFVLEPYSYCWECWVWFGCFKNYIRWFLM